ncbi:SirB2 family protein [Alloalcanivorax xenomutans]|uniref:SirB2 family protein n=2 Tax=Alloalcanivorax xenomutans TaxID=1094342 RepID=A0A9Q3W5D0_9GAMM|nr:SirB2 family protein [Alloalcanivorax xenomutans]ARB47992.1 regulator SirB [Alloalcanivorax xenomutans]MCE7510830.1 SirB2 family protein [Alloalcanivorax xenomutans]MCE7521425.1 SirB2 family protein [Alloalcanivorax xenomutans]WOA33632.1 SirB2 family protein [Alloalcanivorax xenomutans]
MLDYLLIKQLHMTLAALSLGLFVLRAGWSVAGSPMLRRRWVRVTPHIVDTLLLTFGVTLMILLRAWPHQTPWLAAKLLALLVYIGLGTMAIKRGTTPARRAGYALAAVVVFLYMVGVAVRHHPGSWLT